MVSHTDGLHHLHMRKRLHQNHEEYPHPNKSKAIMDKVVYAIAILGPIFTLPQVWTIWTSKSAEGISLWTFGSYFLISIIWVIYGLMHKEKPIVISHVLFGILFFLIFLGGIMYG